jgi:YqjK-like protein
MASTAIELALKKQRLQIASEGLRADFGRHASGLMPAFIGADMAVVGAQWVRHNREIVVAVGVALLVIRPRSAIAWARRGFVLWRVWRDFRDFLERRLPPIRQH